MANGARTLAQSGIRGLKDAFCVFYILVLLLVSSGSSGVEATHVEPEIVTFELRLVDDPSRPFAFALTESRIISGEYSAQLLPQEFVGPVLEPGDIILVVVLVGAEGDLQDVPVKVVFSEEDSERILDTVIATTVSVEKPGGGQMLFGLFEVPEVKKSTDVMVTLTVKQFRREKRLRFVPK